jgi:hypothetical protein
VVLEVEKPHPEVSFGKKENEANLYQLVQKMWHQNFDHIGDAFAPILTAVDFGAFSTCFRYSRIFNSNAGPA